MKRHNLVFSLFLTLALSACAAGLVAPKSFQDQVAYGIASVTAARSTTQNLLERGRITKAEAQQFQGYADDARSAFELALTLRNTGDLSKAEDQLKLARDALTALERKLAEKEGK